MRPTGVAVLVLLLAGAAAAPAPGASDSHSFTQGHPNQLGGGFTEVRTVEVTIRKLR
jgi:hypothetical protein